MSLEVIRAAAFLVGLFGFLSWEFVASDHPPTAPRPRRWIANLSFALLNGGIVSLVCVACYAMALHRTIPWRVGPFERLGLEPWLRIGAEILALDLVVYLLHRAYHRVPLFWQFHKVHHSDLDLDVTSASRFHLGEVTVSAGAKLAVVAILGISPLGLVTFETVMLLAAQFQHSNLRLPKKIDRILWYSFVPPSMHRIHHNPQRVDTDSNYGTIVTAWDWLFGTLRWREHVLTQFGLPQYRDEGELGFFALVGMPFRRRGAARP